MELSVLFDGSGGVKDIVKVLCPFVAVLLQNPLGSCAEVDDLLLKEELKRQHSSVDFVRQ
jgi:hypothetical protein